MFGRNNDVPLDFDIDLMLSKSKDNPVFYVNYAHARIVSVLKSSRIENVATNWRRRLREKNNPS